MGNENNKYLVSHIKRKKNEYIKQSVENLCLNFRYKYTIYICNWRVDWSVIVDAIISTLIILFLYFYGTCMTNWNWCTILQIYEQ